MSARIDLNADLGEGLAADGPMLGLVTSASIACGGHAGDADTMRDAVRLAAAHRVVIGAHPGFEDRANFGRKRLDLSAPELAAQIDRQVRTLMAIAEEQGATVRYVKLHGALANLAAADRVTADTAFRAVAAISGELVVLALADSRQVEAAEAAGLRVIPEAYADRAYLADGTLAPRARPDAVLTNEADVVRQALAIAAGGRISTLDGKTITPHAGSICLHGDTPGAVRLAAAVRRALEAAGVELTAFA